MIPSKSMAMVQTGPRALEPQDLPIPEIDDDTALLRIEACGICGSDYEQYEGVLRTPTPAIPGHEPLGVIAKIGDRAARRWGVDEGDRVAVETMLSCRFCPPCLAGQYHLCQHRRIYSYIPTSEAPGLWGAYAQYMFLDANTLVHKMDPALAPEMAVLFNPLGAGFRWAVEIPETGPGDTVVILGPGQRGLASVLATRQAGADKVIVTGLEADRDKLDIARQFGADATIDVENEDTVRRVRELTDGQGVDAVIEIGGEGTLSQSISALRRGGHINVIGYLAGIGLGLSVFDLIERNANLHGLSVGNREQFEGMMDFIGKHGIRPVISRTYPFEEAGQALQDIAEGGNFGKLVVTI